MVRIHAKKQRMRLLTLHLFPCEAQLPSRLQHLLHQRSSLLSSTEEVEVQKAAQQVGEALLPQFKANLELLGGAVASGAPTWSLVGASWAQKDPVISGRETEARDDEEKAKTRRNKKQGASAVQVKAKTRDNRCKDNHHNSINIIKLVLSSPLLCEGTGHARSALVGLCRAAVTLLDHVYVENDTDVRGTGNERALSGLRRVQVTVRVAGGGLKG